MCLCKNLVKPIFSMCICDLCDKTVLCFRKFNMLFQIFFAQRFNLRWWRKCCFDLINHSMRDSIIHEFRTQWMFFRIQCFVCVESQNVEIPRKVFSQWLCFKSHAFDYRFLSQFRCSKHFAFSRNGFDANSFVMMFTQSWHHFFARNAYLFRLIIILQTHFHFYLQSI